MPGSDGIVYIGKENKEKLQKYGDTPKKAMDFLLETVVYLYDFMNSEMNFKRLPGITDQQKLDKIDKRMR